MLVSVICVAMDVTVQVLPTAIYVPSTLTKISMDIVSAQKTGTAPIARSTTGFAMIPAQPVLDQPRLTASPASSMLRYRSAAPVNVMRDGGARTVAYMWGNATHVAMAAQVLLLTSVRNALTMQASTQLISVNVQWTGVARTAQYMLASAIQSAVSQPAAMEFTHQIVCSVMKMQ